MYEPLSVVDVMLDESNPRFAGPVSSQPAAINALIRLADTKLLNLAEDIALRGQMDPTNPPIVLRQDDQLIVLEGNRRFAALKLLRNPDLAAGKATRASIRRIRAKAEAASMDGDGPGAVLCYVVNHREDAQRWIELRHTGENEGVGTDPWNSYQSLTFRRRPGAAEDKAWLVIRAVVSTFDADGDLLADVRAVRDEKFTNFARLIGRHEIRQKMLIELNGDEVRIQSESAFATDILKTVFRDLTTMTVDEIKSGKQQDEYIDDVVAAVRERYPVDSGDDEEESDGSEGTSGSPGGDESSRGETGETFGAPAGGQVAGGGSANPPGGAAGKPGGTGATRRRPSPRGEKKIFYGLTMRHVELRTSAMLKDAQKVNIDTAPSVCAVMVRVVLELALVDVGVSRGWFDDKDSLRKKTRKALLILDPNCDNSLKRDKMLEMAWVKSQGETGDGLAIDEMNAYVHNFMANPTPDSVRGLTSYFRVFLQRLDDYAGDNPKP